GVQTATVVGP
ncbi:hypothetical protein MKD33_00035, partial [Chromobacterium piscinae]